MARKSKPIVEERNGRRIVRTGIYRTEAEIRPATKTWQAQLDAFQAHARHFNSLPASFVNSARELAAETLRPFVKPVKGFPPGVIVQVFDLGNGRQNYTVPESAPPVVHDAAELLHELHALENATELQFKLLSAFNAGRLAERILVRAAEPHALAGLKSAEGSRKLRAILAPESASEYKEWQRLADFETARLIADGEYRPGKVVAYVAGKVKKSSRHVKAHISLPRGKRGRPREK